MSVTRAVIRDRAKQIAQNAPTTGGTGILLLLTDPGDFNEAILQASRQFDLDRPNRRVLDYTVTTAGFRFVLSGTGAIMPTSGVNAWVDGASYLTDVYHPFDATAQGAAPIDRNEWRQVDGPSGRTELEFLMVSPAVGDVLRLLYATPHTILDDAAAANNSIRAGDVDAFVTLAGAWILTMASTKAIQNTGNTGLPNDVVDRRSQSDQFRSAVKMLLERYATLVGKGPVADIQGASAMKDLDVQASHNRGFLWHPSRSH